MESTLKVPLSFMDFSKIIPVNVYNECTNVSLIFL